MDYSRYLLLPLIFSVTAAGQAPAGGPGFEVASIRQANIDPAQAITVRSDGGPGTKYPTRFTAQNSTLIGLILQAYAISYWQLSADALRQQREMFDVAATMEEGTTKEQFESMLQRLLAERFRLKVHWDTREMSLYELTVARNGPKLKTSKGALPAEHPTSGGSPEFPPIKMGSDGYPELRPGRSGSMFIKGRARLQEIDITMEAFARRLSGQVHGPLKDATGLTGKYDISIYWTTGEWSRAPAPASAAGGVPAIAVDTASGPTLVEALKDQLGLALEKKKGPVKVLVVDQYEKLPTAN